MWRSAKHQLPNWRLQFIFFNECISLIGNPILLPYFNTILWCLHNKGGKHNWYCTNWRYDLVNRYICFYNDKLFLSDHSTLQYISICYPLINPMMHCKTFIDMVLVSLLVFTGVLVYVCWTNKITCSSSENFPTMFQTEAISSSSLKSDIILDKLDLGLNEFGESIIVTLVPQLIFISCARYRILPKLNICYYYVISTDKSSAHILRGEISWQAGMWKQTSLWMDFLFRSRKYYRFCKTDWR